MPSPSVAFLTSLAVSALAIAPALAQAPAEGRIILDPSRFQPADLGVVTTSAPAYSSQPPATGAIYEPAPLGVTTAPPAAIPPAGLPAAPMAQPMLPPQEMLAQTNVAAFTRPPVRSDSPDPFIVKLQILLDRMHASPGVIDGYHGENLTKAIVAAQIMNGLPSTGVLDERLWSVLQGADTTPALTTYTLTPEDLAGPFVGSLPSDYSEMAKLDTLAYRDPAEAIAERFHMDELFLRRLNPGATYSVGESIIVADTGKRAQTKVARLVADKATRQLLGYDDAGTLVVAYPATIGNANSPSPTGPHAIGRVAENAEYWYRPDVNFKQGDNTEALRLAPGPNNPIGLVWIGLDKPTYGIHGTPEPSKIDKTNSHGCVRLTNWDVKELVKLVAPGISVDFVGSSEMQAEAR